MKLIFIPAVMLLATTLFAQDSFYRTDQGNIYVYHDQGDTIYLSEIGKGFDPIQCLRRFSEFCHCNEVKATDSVQIDGSGSKELVFFRSCEARSSGHGGTFDITRSRKISKYEVWNPDTKQLIFEAVSNYDYSYDISDLYCTPLRPKGTESYSYDFKIDSTGQITISSIRTSATEYKQGSETVMQNGKEEDIVTEIPVSYSIVADKKEGIYKYVNGKYEIQE